MNKLHLPLLLITASFLGLGACQSGPETSSSTNWYVCETVADCSGVPGATACLEGYCVDKNGERIEKPATSGSGGASADGTGGRPEAGAGSGSGGTGTGAGSGSGGAGTGGGDGGRQAGGSSGSDAGGTSALGGEGGAGGPEPTCDDYSSLKACTTDEDCTTALRQTDCCGGQGVTGIHVSAVAAHAALEQECAAGFPACGCATNGYVLAEDGRSLPPAEDGSFQVPGDAEVGATCEAGLCRSHVAARACGDGLTCAEGELCLFFDTVTGPTQTAEYRCVPNPCGNVAPTCDCAAGLCEIGDGHGRLCQAPSASLAEISCQDQAQ